MLTFREVWTYLRVPLRWWWVLVIGTLLAAGVAFMLTARQPRYYVARTTLMVGDTLNSATPDAQLIGLSNALAAFYAEISKREPILGPVTAKLGLSFPWQVIANYMLATTVNSRASLLDIAVTDTSPERAAAITTAITNELVAYSPNSPEKIAAQRALIQEQLTQAQSNLSLIDQSIEEARELQTQTSGAADLREVRSRLEELERTRQGTQDTYNQLVRLQSSSVANSLSVLEPAQVPTTPLPSKRNLTVAMAGAGGMVLAIIATFLLELLDDRWRGGGDVRARFGMPYLGMVPGARPLISMALGSARVRELAVREAHTQIVLSAVEHGTRSLLVSSPHPSEARSALIVDMAQLFTRSGYRVLLVDADMEQPTLTRMLGGQNGAARPVVLVNGNPELWSNLQPTPMKNVMLLAHNVGAEGQPLTPSLPWSELVENLSRVADVVIFDGPSTLAGVDAALLAPLVDGVVLTLNPARDGRVEVAESKSRLTRQRKTNLLGAVVLTEEQQPSLPQLQRPWLPPMIARRLLGAGSPAPKEQPMPSARPDALEPPNQRVILTPPTLEPSWQMAVPADEPPFAKAAIKAHDPDGTQVIILSDQMIELPAQVIELPSAREPRPEPERGRSVGEASAD